MNEEKRTHWKELADPRYLGAWALPNGADLTVTIEHVKREVITVDGGRKEPHSIMYLDGHKPMILNATNGKTIQGLYGAFVEDWAGKQITLFGSTTRMDGDMVECLRIRPKVPNPVKPGIGAERLARALKQIKAGAYTAAKLRASFTLTQAQEDEVSALERTPAHE